MDQATVTHILKFLSGLSPELLFKFSLLLVLTPFGVVFLVLVLWWINERKRAQMLEQYRRDMQGALDSYGKDVARLANFYENNVELVKSWEKIANGLQDTVVLNTQTMQRMVDVCMNNQFCPNARPKK